MPGIRATKTEGQKIGLMGHIIADFPNRELALSAITTMVENGVSVIEIQIPFSEPMADGPVFMAANHRALAAGVGVEESLELMSLVSKKYPHIDFIFMTYLNIVFKMGYEIFVEKASVAGVRGLIVPDLPIEHSTALDNSCEKHGVDNIRLIAPNTTEDRMAEILSKASGLVYVVARKGVTGSETNFSGDLIQLIGKVRQHTGLPLAVGFGVRDGKGVEALSGLADYAIIGTKAFQVLEEKGVDGLKEFWKQINIAAK